MRCISKINTFFAIMVFLSAISLLLSYGLVWTIVSLFIMIVFITGYVVTDVCIDLVERDIAELLKKAKK